MAGAGVGDKKAKKALPCNAGHSPLPVFPAVEEKQMFTHCHPALPSHPKVLPLRTAKKSQATSSYTTAAFSRTGMLVVDTSVPAEWRLQHG